MQRTLTHKKTRFIMYSQTPYTFFFILISSNFFAHYFPCNKREIKEMNGELKYKNTPNVLYLQSIFIFYFLPFCFETKQREGKKRKLLKII